MEQYIDPIDPYRPYLDLLFMAVKTAWSFFDSEEGKSALVAGKLHRRQEVPEWIPFDVTIVDIYERRLERLWFWNVNVLFPRISVKDRVLRIANRSDHIRKRIFQSVYGTHDLPDTCACFTLGQTCVCKK